jgi:hypothetical protein
MTWQYELLREHAASHVAPCDDENASFMSKNIILIVFLPICNGSFFLEKRKEPYYHSCGSTRKAEGPY